MIGFGKLLGFTTVLTVTFLPVIHCISISSNLSKALFTNYDSGLRPVCDGVSGQVNVTLDVALRQIIDLMEPVQIIKLNAWVRLKWEDCQLSWNPSDYGDVDHIIVPHDRVWTPDLTPYDSTAEQFWGQKEFRPSVYSDGTVFYNFPTVLELRCVVDVLYFPFDKQTCDLTFGSWAHHGLEMDLKQKNDAGDLASYEVNVEWEVESFEVIRHVLYYNCCPEPYPDVTYVLKLKRKPLFYILNIVLPCLLITGIALLGFIMPAESGEKVSLEITVVLALSVFLLLLAESLPPSSETVPLIADYFAFVMFLVASSCAMVVVVLNVHFRGIKPMPPWVRKVFLVYLAKVLFVKFPEQYSIGHRKTKKQEESNKDNNQNHQLKGTNKVSPEGEEDGEFKELQADDTLPPIRQSPKKINGLYADIPSVFTTQVNNYTDTVERLGNHLLLKEDEEKRSREWRAVATVLDRLALALFLFFWIVGSIVLFAHFSKA